MTGKRQSTIVNIIRAFALASLPFASPTERPLAIERIPEVHAHGGLQRLPARRREPRRVREDLRANLVSGRRRCAHIGLGDEGDWRWLPTGGHASRVRVLGTLRDILLGVVHERKIRMEILAPDGAILLVQRRPIRCVRWRRQGRWSRGRRERSTLGEGAVERDVQLLAVASDRADADERPDLVRQMRELAPQAGAVLAIHRLGACRVGAPLEQLGLNICGKASLRAEAPVGGRVVDVQDRILKGARKMARLVDVQTSLDDVASFGLSLRRRPPTR